MSMKQGGRAKMETYEDKTDRSETWREHQYEAKWKRKDRGLREHE
jgi:hypothetical protein